MCISSNEYTERNYKLNLYMNNKRGEWLLVDGENFMSIQPQYCCSVCKDMISTYYPPNVCIHCGAFNEYKGNLISVRMESVDE